MFMLVTGEPGSGRHYYNEAEAEKYAIENQRCVYSFPFKGFEIKSAKEVELNRLANTRRAGIYQITIKDTFDKSELINKYIPRIKNSLIIIPACPAYTELIHIALSVRNEKDNDIMLIRDTVKDFGKITTIIPDCFRIHADTTLPIQKVYAAELSEQIGKDNALAFLIAQWIVNLQQEVNKKSNDDIFKLGYFLYVQGAKIITKQQFNEASIDGLRELILSEGVTMIKSRFGVESPDSEIRNDLLIFLD